MADDLSTYRVPRKDFISAYIDNMVTLLSNTCKDRPEDLKQFVTNIVNERYIQLKGDIILNRRYGAAEILDKIDILRLFVKNNQSIIAPSGSIYYTIKDKKSLMYEFIKHYLDTRKVLKKEMLKATEAGDTVTAQIKNYGQATVKIRANSIIGGTGSEYSFCYNKAAFNSVTSMSRNTIMNAYAFTERFLTGNFYFPTYDHLLNYITVLLQVCPDANTVYAFAKKYGLYMPDMADVLDLFKSYLDTYTNDTYFGDLRILLNGLSLHQLFYLYYANNFYLLAQKNRDVIRSMIQTVFREDTIDYSDKDSIDPNDLFKYDGDLLIVLNTHYTKLLGDVSLYDTPKLAPDIARQLVCIARYMTEKVTPLMEIIDFICHHHLSISNTIAHKSMYRSVVANSDTDSVIFTTKEWVKWYTGDYNFTQEAFDIDVLATYFLSKTVAWLMYTISEQRGAMGKDLLAMNMKNEFLYPVMMSCIIPKHYAGIITMQEGRVLAKPKKDIKGVSFRGSSMQKITLDNTTDFIMSIIDDIYDKDHPEYTGTINIHKYIQKVIDYECHILRSLRKGETTFLNVDPVKEANEYANPDSSIYFNYQIWRSVFEQKYGEIQIPTKCHIVPLNPTLFFNEGYRAMLRENYPDIFINLMDCLGKIGNKKITRIPLNPALESIPPELIPLIDAKSIVYKNCAPLYLALESFGLSTGIPTNKKVLYVDYFGVSEDYIYGKQNKA